MALTSILQRTGAFLHRATHPLVRKGWAHWVRFLLLLAAGTYVGHWLGESERFADVRDAIYQKQIQLQRRGQLYPQHTVLLLLDDDDFWGPRFQGREPVKRDQLAILLDRLNQAGANTVALDFDLRSSLPAQPDFDFPDYAAENRALIEAVGRMCTAGRHVVLASSVRYSTKEVGKDEEPFYAEMPSIYTAELAHLPCVGKGYIQLSYDKRKMPGLLKLEDGTYLDSFSLAITKFGDPVAYANAARYAEKSFRFGQYLTEADYSPREGRQFVFNGVSVMKMDDVALRQAVADKTVIVGASWHRLAYGTGRRTDMWPSPGGEQPGAMLHANYVEATRDRTGTFAPISDEAAEYLEWSMALALGVLSVLEVHAGWKWGGFGLTLLLSLVLTYVLLQNLGIFLDFFVPLLMIVGHTIVEELIELRHHLQHLRHQLHGQTVHVETAHANPGPQPDEPTHTI